MEAFECNSSGVDSNNSFLSEAIIALEDNKLSIEERDSLNSIINNFNLEKEQEKENCKNQISKIRNEIELKNIIKASENYSEVLSDILNLKVSDIKNIQFIL
jgi:hypothetical protein